MLGKKFLDFGFSALFVFWWFSTGLNGRQNCLTGCVGRVEVITESLFEHFREVDVFATLFIFWRSRRCHGLSAGLRLRLTGASRTFT